MVASTERLENLNGCAKITSMLIPRFSLRLLVAATTLSSLFFYVVHLAMQEHLWAIALTLGFSSLLLVLVLHTTAFSVAWSLGIVWRSMIRKPTTTSPFVTDAPPPQQILPPEDVE